RAPQQVFARLALRSAFPNSFAPLSSGLEPSGPEPFVLEAVFSSLGRGLYCRLLRPPGPFLCVGRSGRGWSIRECRPDRVRRCGGRSQSRGQNLPWRSMLARDHGARRKIWDRARARDRIRQSRRRTCRRRKNQFPHSSDLRRSSESFAITRHCTIDRQFAITMLNALRYYWIISRGYRLTPWRSPYVRWRMETFFGKEASELDARKF